MADPLQLIAYPPINRIIKQEVLNEPQETNSVEGENWTLQLPKDSVAMANPHPLIAYAPVQPKVKLEILDENRKVDNAVEGDNQKLIQDSEYDKGSEKSEHSSLQDFDDSFALDSTDDEDLIPSPKAGPSKEPTRQVQKPSHCKKSALQKAPFKCCKCERSYERKASLTVHLKFECGLEPQFQCTMTNCDRQFKQMKSLRKHLITIHQVDEKQLDKHGAGLKKFQVLPFKCSKCETSFKRNRTLVQHMNHECGVAFTCSECQQNCKTKCSLRAHLLSVHKIARHQLDQFGAGYKVRPEQPYKCDQCDRTYRLKGSLTRHKKAECGAEPSLLCPQCDYRAKIKSNLKLHLMEAHNVEHSQLPTLGLGPVRQGNQFQCDLCGRSYKHKKQLKLHFRQKCGK